MVAYLSLCTVQNNTIPLTRVLSHIFTSPRSVSKASSCSSLTITLNPHVRWITWRRCHASRCCRSAVLLRPPLYDLAKLSWPPKSEMIGPIIHNKIFPNLEAPRYKSLKQELRNPNTVEPKRQYQFYSKGGAIYPLRLGSLKAANKAAIKDLSRVCLFLSYSMIECEKIAMVSRSRGSRVV